MLNKVINIDNFVKNVVNYNATDVKKAKLVEIDY